MFKAGLTAIAALVAAVALIAAVTTAIIATITTSALDRVPIPIPRPDTAAPPTTSAPATPGRPRPTNPPPAPSGDRCVPTPGPSGGVPGYGPEQMTNAAEIIAVGKRMGVPQRGWVVAIAAALAESGLRNLNHGDRDSLGLFQQRPSQGWGTPQQILNPTYAATQFYTHLVKIPNWQNMSINDAAQIVQRSATPQVYAKFEQPARTIVNTTQNSTCTPNKRSPAPTNPNRARPGPRHDG